MRTNLRKMRFVKCLIYGYVHTRVHFNDNDTLLHPHQDVHRNDTEYLRRILNGIVHFVTPTGAIHRLARINVTCNMMLPHLCRSFKADLSDVPFHTLSESNLNTSVLLSVYPPQI